MCGVECPVPFSKVQGNRDPMPRLPRQHLIDLTLRFVMIAVCAVPFTGLRAYANALPATVPVGQLPTAPSEEENERAEDAKQRVGHRIEHRPDPPRAAPRLPVAASAFSVRATSSVRPAPADPFRNGLGTPY